jgi:hypothetical protein
MRKLVSCIAITAMLGTSACSTNGGMYSAGSATHGEFSTWKTVGAVFLGVLTLGAIGAGAYAGASNRTYSYSSTPVFISGDNYRRTYLVNGEYVTCYRTGSYIKCY